jgi:hypothetical protein
MLPVGEIDFIIRRNPLMISSKTICGVADGVSVGHCLIDFVFSNSMLLQPDNHLGKIIPNPARRTEISTTIIIIQHPSVTLHTGMVSAPQPLFIRINSKQNL